MNPIFVLYAGDDPEAQLEEHLQPHIRTTGFLVQCAAASPCCGISVQANGVPTSASDPFRKFPTLSTSLVNLSDG